MGGRLGYPSPIDSVHVSCRAQSEYDVQSHLVPLDTQIGDRCARDLSKSADRQRRRNPKLLTYLLFALEDVQSPILQWFPSLWRLVILQLHTLDSVGLLG